MNERYVRFLDPELHFKAICTDLVSLKYTKRFCGAGEFECVVPAFASSLPEPDDFAVCGGELYVVEKVSRSSLTGEIAVCGRGALSLLSRRIVPLGFTRRRSVEGEACDLVRTYAASAFPAPIDVDTPEGSGAVGLVVEAGDLYERVVRLVSSVRKGVSLTWDDSRRRFGFAVTGGVDRRLSNAEENDVMFLSEGFGTVAGVSEVTDKSKYINRVTVRGSMTSDGTVLATTVDASDYVFPDGTDDSAEALREGYVKSGIGITMFTHDDGEGGRVFDREAYFDALRERGREELALCRVSLSLEASLIGDAAESANVGDLCTLSTPASDVGTVRVTELTYEYKGDRERCVARLLALG